VDPISALDIRKRGLLMRYVTLHLGSTEEQLLRDLTWATPALVQRCVDMNLLRREGRVLRFNGSWTTGSTSWAADDSSASMEDFRR
jgi:hypothetical protein